MTDITKGAEAFGEGMKADKESDFVAPQLSLKDIRLLIECMELVLHDYTDPHDPSALRDLHARLTHELFRTTP